METHLQEARARVAEKMDECEKESSLLRRAQEEVAILRKKVDKYKNREQSTMGDEVLLEEIRMYKVRRANCVACFWLYVVRCWYIALLLISAAGVPT